MRVSDRIELTGHPRAIERIHAQCLQEPIELLAARSLLRDHEVLVDQPAHDVEHGDRVDVAQRRRDRLGRFHREGAGQDTEPAEDQLLVLVQQVVTPLHRRGERLLAGEQRAGAPREEAEAIVELERDPLG